MTNAAKLQNARLPAHTDTRGHAKFVEVFLEVSRKHVLGERTATKENGRRITAAGRPLVEGGS